MVDGEPLALRVTHTALEMVALQLPPPLFDFPARTLYAPVLPSDIVKLEKDPIVWLLPNKVTDQLFGFAVAPLTLVMV
jgi:hypothetical protein